MVWNYSIKMAFGSFRRP